MKIVPSFLTLGLLSACLPPVGAQPAPAPPYRVLVEWQKATPSSRGLTITGKIRNVGTEPLTYVQVVPLLSDQAGRIVYRGSGYLTVSPLKPGQSAEFRAYAPDAPAFRRVSLSLRESGRPVVVREEAPGTGSAGLLRSGSASGTKDQPRRIVLSRVAASTQK